MGERDRVARTDAEAAPTCEVVDRPCDDPEAHSVQLAEKGRDLAWERPVHKRLEEDRFRSVLTLVHRDELGEHGIGALSTRAPSLDPSDQTLGASAQRRVHQALLRRRVQVHRARSDMRASRDFADAELRIAAPRDLAQGCGLDRARRARRRARTLALDVSPIHCITSVSE